jgi:hypothetical protein
VQPELSTPEHFGVVAQLKVLILIYLFYSSVDSTSFLTRFSSKKNYWIYVIFCTILSYFLNPRKKVKNWCSWIMGSFCSDNFEYSDAIKSNIICQ